VRPDTASKRPPPPFFFNLGSDIPSLGAWGAIAAVMGACAVMFPGARVKMLVFLGFRAGITQVSALVFLGIWFLSQLLSGVASLGPQTAQTSAVAFWAHTGGFVLGLAVSTLFRGRAQQMSLESAEAETWHVSDLCRPSCRRRCSCSRNWGSC
jgi:membrane associated rhomboid family serine protease